MALDLRHTYDAEKTVYHFLAVSGGIQRYSKVKSVLRYLQEYKFNVDVTYAFYNLIKWGIIIPTINNSYRLSEPMVISDTKTGRSIGINLGAQSRIPAPSADYQDIGLLIFEDSSDQLKELDVAIQYLNPLKRLKQMQPLGKMVKANCTESFLPKFKGRIRLFEPKTNSWIEPKTNRWEATTISKLNELNACLLKSYSSYNEYYFEYVFKYDGVYYRFQLADVETINLIKTYLILQTPISTSFYSMDNGVFSLSNTAPFPFTIERILAAQHMLNTRRIAFDRRYQLDTALTRRLEKILSV